MTGNEIHAVITTVHTRRTRDIYINIYVYMIAARWSLWEYTAESRAPANTWSLLDTSVYNTLLSLLYISRVRRVILLLHYCYYSTCSWTRLRARGNPLRSNRYRTIITDTRIANYSAGNGIARRTILPVRARVIAIFPSSPLRAVPP